ncbi:MAG: RNA 2',3'-cyclic phosphodiesterase [Planctomycetes bacterium]|nr:RNA 2',3'-cyclic phosphodiesterase [Planctomycetota bacterium]
MLRLFIALEMDHSLRAGIEALVNDIKHLGLHASWVPVSNMHLTLKFLGDTDEKHVESIKKILDECACVTAPFETALQGIGVFPDIRRPRVLWLGCSAPSGTISKLHGFLESKLSALGFPLENRRFLPHLTLARIKSPKNMEFFRGFLGEKHGNLLIGTSRMEGITLFKSDLLKTGAVYTALYKVRMKNEK